MALDPTFHGLTEAEAKRLRELGGGNTPPPPITKSASQIVRGHVCTLFNLFNVLIAIALALVGAWSNLLFILIIALNTVIGIVQELHAKKLVEQIAVLTAPKARTLRSGCLRELPVEELVLGDVISLESGMQVPADALVLEGEVETDESLLTGESIPVRKTPGEMLFSGSVVVSGACMAQVERVGADNYATRLTQEARAAAPGHSELLTSMGKVTRFTAFLIPPLGLLLFFQTYFLRGAPPFDAVTTTAAGLLGMLPKGLVLLITVSLAVGVAKLARSRVLVQNLFSLESLAHVDVLCLDKTGTLTEGNMRLERMVPLAKNPPIPLTEWMGAFLAHSDDNNATFQAMRRYFSHAGSSLEPMAKIPFSSQRKWSAMTFPEVGTLAVGAPDRMTGADLPEELRAEIQKGKRVLMIASTSYSVDSDAPLPEMTVLAALVLSDPTRSGAADTLAYFRREGVAVKVISGDYPAAAAAVAARAGLENASAWVDMSRVDTEEGLRRAAAKYTVFGRVSPEQKRQLVEAFQAQGHRVAMTGDGVNDILAMRKADCSIAMAHGSQAARQAAQVVLLDSDFTALPRILLEGRRVVNNMTRVAGVFFVKTIYSILLSLFCVLTNLPFPLIPIQVTLIDLFIEGYPAFFQSFVPDGRKLTGRFLPSVLRRSLPNAVAILLASAALLLGGSALGLPAGQVPLALYLVIGAVEAEALLKSCLPLTPLRGFLFLTASAGFFCAVLLFHDLLSLPPLLPGTVPAVLLTSAVSILAERLCSFGLGHIPRRRSGDAKYLGSACSRSA